MVALRLVKGGSGLLLDEAWESVWASSVAREAVLGLTQLTLILVVLIGATCRSLVKHLT